MFENIGVVIKGAGDIASGVAYRLYKAGFPIVMTELALPLTIRRSVSFSEAIFEGEIKVEGILARRIDKVEEIKTAWQEGWIPVLIDPQANVIQEIKSKIVVDAILAKRNLGTKIDDAALVVGLGPGFFAGRDVDAVIETNRGHYLGRVIWDGSAQADTGTPGVIGGAAASRVIYSPDNGVFQHAKVIGDLVEVGETLGNVNDFAVPAKIKGCVRGLIHDGIKVKKGLKIGDIDPRGEVDHCWTISEKALAIGGGVTEAILTFLNSEGIKNGDPECTK
jgi:xanthine dehydrogenase accessory factor